MSSESPKHFLPETQEAHRSIEGKLTSEKAIKLAQLFFVGTYLDEFQYAYIGQDIFSSENGHMKDDGGEYDEAAGIWTFPVYARPFFDEAAKQLIGKVSVAIDGSVTSEPSKESMHESVGRVADRFRLLLDLKALGFLVSR